MNLRLYQVEYFSRGQGRGAFVRAPSREQARAVVQDGDPYADQIVILYEMPIAGEEIP